MCIWAQRLTASPMRPWIYFSKAPTSSPCRKQALIAGPAARPVGVSRSWNEDLALQRRSTVLGRMRQAGFISAFPRADRGRGNRSAPPALPKYWKQVRPLLHSWWPRSLPMC